VKAHNELSAHELRIHADEVKAAAEAEVQSFIDLKTFVRAPRASENNILTSRWLFKFKRVSDTEKKIKGRLCVRGFEDLDAQHLATWANTATRWGQRIVVSVAAQNRWTLLSADVGTAFLRGLTFGELASLTGEVERHVCFDPPAAYRDIFTRMAKFDKFCWERETLKMVKPIYGLKDAPRAWRKKLHESLLALGLHSLLSDSALYTLKSDGALQLLCSAHVDDLKMCGTEKALQWLLTQLEAMFGKLSVSRNSFEHCGLMHEQNTSSFAVTVHQNHYVASLVPIDLAGVDCSDESVKATPLQHQQYQSLLGGIGWLTQTRQDICVYVQALQRRNHAPSLANIMRLNKLTRWVKRRPVHLLFQELQTPALRIVAVSDAAFRREDVSGLAMRGAQILLCESWGSHPGGRCHHIEWYSKRQRRICRSTFGAEINALGDAHETAKVVAYAYAEITSPTQLTASQLFLMSEKGTWPYDVEAVIDCRSVFDALACEEPKQPTESSLLMLLLQLKQELASRSLSKLWWVSTTDMLADALNKGMVSRSAVLRACMQGMWILHHDTVFHQELKRVAVASPPAPAFK